MEFEDILFLVSISGLVIAMLIIAVGLITLIVMGMSEPNLSPSLETLKTACHYPPLL